jgi:hypothetical protein
MTGLTPRPERCNNCDGHKAEMTGELEGLESRNDRNDRIGMFAAPVHLCEMVSCSNSISAMGHYMFLEHCLFVRTSPVNFASQAQWK